MDKSAQVFFGSVGVFILVVLCIGFIGEFVFALVKVEYVNPHKSKEQWQLEARLSWKCYVANYAWRLRFPWAVQASLKAAVELEEWTQGEIPQVIVRWNPASPSKRRYRLCDRFDLYRHL